MSTIELTAEFEDSYQRWQEYPRNLVHHEYDDTTLQLNINRFQQGIRDTFLDASTQGITSGIEVPFRDCSPNSTGLPFIRQNIDSEGHLRQWLHGSDTTPQGSYQKPDLMPRKPDPKCRFIFFFGGHSRTQLRCTEQMMYRVLTFHQVMPDYLDFLCLYGRQIKPRNLGFCRFRTQVTIDNPTMGLDMPELNRSGRGYQMCYNLKTVARVSSPASNNFDSATFGYDNSGSAQWSIRQAAIHHQFDIEKGTALWIITKGDKDLKDRLSALTGPYGRPDARAFEEIPDSFQATLATHLFLCQWSISEWDWYIEWLETMIDKETYIVVVGNFGVDDNPNTITSDTIQKAQRLEEQIGGAVIALESNLSIYKSLVGFYRELWRNPKVPFKRSPNEPVSDTFGSQIETISDELRMKLTRLTVLRETVRARKTLIEVQLQAKSNEISQKVSVEMYEMGQRSQKEALRMRIITVVTLIYLPPTFVSTFFSTDVVKYQDPSRPEGAFSLTALERWFQIAFPLTAFTLILSYLVQRSSSEKLSQHGERVRSMSFFRKHTQPLEKDKV